MNKDKYYMQIALDTAKKAFDNNEIPVGAIIVKNDEIISIAHNQKDSSKIVTKHAEIIAIEAANLKFNDWRLNECTIYVTMEPCPMCAGAIQQSRIKRLVYGCKSNIDENSEIIQKILKNNIYNHQVSIEKGILEEECSNILKDFFKNKR